MAAKLTVIEGSQKNNIGAAHLWVFKFEDDGHEYYIVKSTSSDGGIFMLHSAGCISADHLK